MTAPDPLDAADGQPQPTPDAVLDWIADRINARPWPIGGGYPTRMQGIDDGAADLDLLPADFDPEEDWEDPPAPVARYRITISPCEPAVTADPMSDPVRRAQAAHAAFVARDPRMDPGSAAAYGCWVAALEAAGVPELLAEIEELKAASRHAARLRIRVDDRLRELRAAVLGRDPQLTEGAGAAVAVALRLRADLAEANDRAADAEAAVERVRALAGEFDAGAQQIRAHPGLDPHDLGTAVGWSDAAERVRRALDAAGTPAPSGAPGYTIRVRPAEVDGGWIAEVVERPGCMSQGETPAEALAGIADALAAVLAAAEEGR